MIESLSTERLFSFGLQTPNSRHHVNAMFVQWFTRRPEAPGGIHARWRLVSGVGLMLPSGGSSQRSSVAVADGDAALVEPLDERNGVLAGEVEGVSEFGHRERCWQVRQPGDEVVQLAG